MSKYPLTAGNIYIEKITGNIQDNTGKTLTGFMVHLSKDLEKHIMEHKDFYQTNTMAETFGAWISQQTHSASCGQYKINSFTVRKKCKK